MPLSCHTSDTLATMSSDNMSDHSESEDEAPTSQTRTDTIGSWSHLRCPELIVKEAFEEHPLRVTRQIAAATGVTVGEVLETFRVMKAETEWDPSLGYTPQDIFEYAKCTEVGAYLYNGGRLERAEQRHNKDKTAIVFTVWCDVAYFYKGLGPRARDDAQGPRFTSPESLGPQDPKPRKLTELTKSVKHPPKSVEEMEPFPWSLELADVPAGSYWIPSEWTCDHGDEHRHIYGLVVRFLQSRSYPRVSKLRYGDVDKPFEITYHKIPSYDNGSGTIVVRSHARDVQTTAAWAKRLEVPYSGQSLGPFTNVVLDTLLRRKQRRYLSDTEKEVVLLRQGRNCNLCGDAVGSDGVFDHTIPLHSMTSDQNIEAFQFLCGQCSANKTKAEERPCVGILRSRFNKTVWESYVLSPKLHCMA